MSTQPPVRQLVVIEDSLLAAMAQQPNYAAAFPFLAALASVKPAAKTCGSCGGAPSKDAKAYAAARTQLGMLDKESKARLKQLLNAKFVRIKFQDGGGKKFELTF